MSLAAQLVPRTITLEELISLSEEIAALARAGVPLDRGLLAIGADLPGRLGKLATALGERLEKGESLVECVANSGFYPPSYKAVVEAGIRVGRLPAALEDVARSARRTSQMRKSVGIALIYPAIVLAVAYLLFLFGILRILPVMLRVCEAWDVRVPGLLATSDWLQTTMPFWGPAIPLIAVLWIATVWYRSGRITHGSEVHPLLRWGVLGSLAKMRTAGRLAALNELLAMLVEHGVPLHEALPLAGAAVGSARLECGARELAEKLRRGEVASSAPRGFPPMLAWMLSSANSQVDLPALLRRSAENYRDDAARQAQWVSTYLPMIITIGFAGTVVVLYAIMTLAPWLLVLHRIAEVA